MFRNTRVVTSAASVAMVAALAAALSGCGGDDGGGDASGSTSIKIGKAVDTIGFSIIDVAMEQGYFEDAGLDVEVATLNGSTVANGALESGDIQFAGYSSLPLLLAREKGADIVSIATVDYGVPMRIVAGGEYAEALDPDAPLKERITGLEGAKIGFVSSTDGGFLDMLLNDIGLGADAVDKVQFNNVQAAVTAAESGEIDGAIGSPPATVAAVEEGEMKTVASLSEVEKYAETSYELLNTTAGYAESNPEVVTGVATAIARAAAFVNDPANKESLVALEVEKFSGFSEETLRKSLEAVTFAENGLHTRERWDNAVELYSTAGVIEGDAAEEGTAWTNEYIDTEAVK